MHDFLNRLGIDEMNLGGFAGDWVGSGPAPGRILSR